MGNGAREQGKYLYQFFRLEIAAGVLHFRHGSIQRLFTFIFNFTSAPGLGSGSFGPTAFCSSRGAAYACRPAALAGKSGSGAGSLRRAHQQLFGRHSLGTGDASGTVWRAAAGLGGDAEPSGMARVLYARRLWAAAASWRAEHLLLGRPPGVSR